MKHAVVALLVTLAVVACEPTVKVPPPEAAEEAALPTVDPRVMPVNIGDVEAQVHIYVDVPEGVDEAENIEMERLQTRKYDLGMVTLDIYPPYPTSLVINAYLANNLSKRDAPLVLRGAIQVDEQPVKSYAVLLTKESDRKPELTEVDVLAGMTEYPETMLINSKTTAVLLPVGTDPATIDPETVTGTKETQSVLLSNPVRVNFHKEAPAEGSGS